jgi:phosphatidate cytidylyltransferase
MLPTRLWMGAILILLTTGVLVLDNSLAPWYPFLFLLLLTLALLSCHELLHLFTPDRRPWPWLCYAGVGLLIAANWPAHLGHDWLRQVSPDASHWVLGSFAAFVLAAFVLALATFEPPGESSPDTVVRLALAVFLVAYLGVMPGFLAQIRWNAGDDRTRAALALTLAIFVPKCCDIGAYAVGRLIGRHRMTPVVSPGKTWEGLAGGLTVAVAVAIGLNRLGPVLPSDTAAAGFGLTVGVTGVLGDLAESLLKRQYRHKDASQTVPGFGGVLDVVDSIVFASPVAYCWLA